MPKHLGFIYLDLTLYFTDSTSFRVLLTEAINLNTQIFCTETVSILIVDNVCLFSWQTCLSQF